MPFSPARSLDQLFSLYGPYPMVLWNSLYLESLILISFESQRCPLPILQQITNFFYDSFIITSWNWNIRKINTQMTFLFNAGQLKKVIHKYIRVLNSQNENFIFFIIFKTIPMRWNETLTTHFWWGGASRT